MDFSQFDALATKVTHAVEIIEGLKREKESLQSEVHMVLEKSGNLEKTLAERDEEISLLKNEINNKSDNMNLVGERIRDIVGRLDTALA